ncbi:MAG: PASTA domain-containing protein [Clostridiales bacterium]|nr:PASTA domain-containing protein [Clostridiales bacterium]
MKEQHIQDTRDADRWTCPNCGRENGPEAVCPGCGFDSSTNYLAYPTLMQLPLPKEIQPAAPKPEPKADAQSTPKYAREENNKIWMSSGANSAAQSEPERKKRRRVWAVAALAVALLVVWAAAYTSYRANHTKVENYLGMEIESAASQAGEELTLEREAQIVSDSNDYGVVVEQSVSAGKMVKKDEVFVTCAS